MMKSKTVYEIVKDYLNKNGYAGLCDKTDCKCSINELMSCAGADEYIPNCQAVKASQNIHWFEKPILEENRQENSYS